jgi:hypothetical protein
VKQTLKKKTKHKNNKKGMETNEIRKEKYCLKNFKEKNYRKEETK